MTIKLDDRGRQSLRLDPEVWTAIDVARLRRAGGAAADYLGSARLLSIPRLALAAIPDDDPTLALDLPLDRIEPYASVMPAQFVRDDNGHFPVRERHAERLSAIVHLRPPNIWWTGGLDRTPDELFGQKSH